MTDATTTQTVVLATMETFNFTFTALGVDADDALRILSEAWRLHTAEYRLGGNRGEMDLVAEWGVTFTEMAVGHAARDGEVIFKEGA